jgi:hypothetical protein
MGTVRWLQGSSARATVGPTPHLCHIAFGGFKQSGVGREGGTEGLLPYLESKTVLLVEPPHSGDGGLPSSGGPIAASATQASTWQQADRQQVGVEGLIGEQKAS